MRNAATLVALVAVLGFAVEARSQSNFSSKANGFVWLAKTPTPVPKAAPADAFLIRYASNLNVGDSVVNISNAGSLGGTSADGTICVNVYVFSPDESIIACCSCPIKPNSLVSLSARTDLIANTLTPAVPTSIVIKLLATAKDANACNAATPTFAKLAKGMRAWGTTIHAGVAAGSYEVTETEFAQAALSASELADLTLNCSVIQSQGMGFGICRTCRLGGM
jgi:hypothetical protein